jgi:hypothetical protein
MRRASAPASGTYRVCRMLDAAALPARLFHSSAQWERLVDLYHDRILATCPKG